MSTENINFKLQIGQVHSAQSYFRFDVHNDQNVKGQLQGVTGSFPENQTIFVKIHTSVTDEQLDGILGAVLPGGYTGMKGQGLIQEFFSGSDRWIKVPFASLPNGEEIAGQFIPILDSNPDLSGNLSFNIESDATFHDWKNCDEKELSRIYTIFKSLRASLTTNFTKGNLTAISELMEQFTGSGIPRDLFELFAEASFEFDSFEDLPVEVTNGLLDAKKSPLFRTIDKIVNLPIFVTDQPFELHVFVNENNSVRVSASLPGITSLRK